MQIRIINVTRTAIKEMHKVEEMKTRNDMFISKHVLQHVPNKLRGQQVEIANHFINPGMKWEDVRSIIEDTINTEAYDGLLVIYEDDVISMKHYLNELYRLFEKEMRLAQHFNLVYRDSVLHAW